MDLTNTDRFGLTVFASILAHMVVILGVSFSFPEVLPQLRSAPTLDIVLVNSRSDETPDEAELLAQANQDGGGSSEEAVTASSPLPLRVLPTATRNVPSARPVPAGTRFQAPQESLLHLPEAEDRVLVRAPRVPSPVAAHEAARNGVVAEPTSSADRAQLSAEISQDWEEYQKRPRRKFLSARTREYRYAAYMEAWRAKVEEVGNRNYPEAARAQRLTGSLILNVALNPDGSVRAIDIERPSAHKVLDDAAMRIVQLASPYLPFPEEIREETDVLHITRTWQFMHGDRLTAR